MEKGVKITLLICATILIVAILGYFAFNQFAPQNYSDTVNVQGSGVVKAVPDLITIYYSIETQGTTSQDAKDKNDLVFDKLKAELDKVGISSDKLQTQSFSIYENIEWINGKSTKNGFKATHTLQLELPSENFDKVSEAIDSGVAAGAQINSINFELSPTKQSEYKSQAIKLASDDAQNKAQALAEGFGKQVGKLVSVSVDEYYYAPRNLYTNMGGAMTAEATVAKDAVSNLTPSDQDVSARVSATFKIK
ncbi:Uncharacterised protein [uncultured archaeon]|nr:Uncharacterised protein [uncultured archaeon]